MPGSTPTSTQPRPGTGVTLSGLNSAIAAASIWAVVSPGRGSAVNEVPRADAAASLASTADDGDPPASRSGPLPAGVARLGNVRVEMSGAVTGEPATIGVRAAMSKPSPGGSTWVATSWIESVPLPSNCPVAGYVSESVTNTADAPPISVRLVPPSMVAAVSASTPI